MPNLGIPELIVIFLIVILLFGGSRLPLIGRGLGEGIRNFKKGMRGGEDDTPERLEGKADNPRPQ
jgi:sec-independent protein translocase protein TatA